MPEYAAAAAAVAAAAAAATAAELELDDPEGLITWKSSQKIQHLLKNIVSKIM
jgi:hypothetical protein